MNLQGVLPSQDIREFIKKGMIISSSEIKEESIQPASLDLTLGKKCFKIGSSTLPSDVIEYIKNNRLEEFDITEAKVLEPGIVYVVKLRESLKLPVDVRAYSNPKSTSGRLDIFVRLLTTKDPKFDSVPSGYEGDLYLEILSQSFPIVINEGVSLNQIRFFRGDTDFNVNAIRSYNFVEPVVFDSNRRPLKGEELIIDSLDNAGKAGIIFTLDLKKGDNGIVGYKAKRYLLKPINLSVESKMDDSKKIDPRDYFEPIYASKNGELILDPQYFYILSTNEFLNLPSILCATIVSQQATIGELRTHYAGFFDPGWGHGEGWQATLEIRSFVNPFRVRHGQPICKFVFDIVSSAPDKVYATEKLGTSNYEKQIGPKLAKYFKKFPSNNI